MDLTVQILPSGASCVALSGRLDTVGVDRIETRFNAAVASGGRDALIDLTDVSFVSSMGVRLLITAARSLRSRGHGMALFGAQGSVASTLGMVEIDQIIPMLADVAQAEAHLAGQH